MYSSSSTALGQRARLALGVVAVQAGSAGGEFELGGLRLDQRGQVARARRRLPAPGARQRSIERLQVEQARDTARPARPAASGS
ncbi:MAG: hypothetical protein MZV49_17395 [Rhodopseudomonas palustris]|nr:hypothetical protein [Rhodopseudomonas palustris]